jgi:hypothetical protein
MSANELKTPIVFYQPLAMRTATQNENQQRAQGLPCHVVKVVSSGIVEVAFDVTGPPYTFPQSTLPVHMSEWGRIPVQVGDKGYAVPADAYLGGVTGLGGGTADLVRRGNLTSLAFQPLGNASWPAVDPNAYTLYGPNGAVLKDQQDKNNFTLTPNAVTLTLTVGDVTITVPSGQRVTINGDLHVVGTIYVTGDILVGPSSISFLSHIHGTPSGNSGPPLP